jgi:beta-lactamase class A
MKTLLLLLFMSLTLNAQNAKPAPNLDERIRAEVAAFKGKVWLYAKNLDTGAVYSFNGDERVRTASTIKLAIMVEAFSQVAEGKIKWTDEIILTKEKKVGGAGILFEFADNLKVTLRDALHLMITISDNTATNLVLDAVTADAVNARMDKLGFKHTRSLRKVFGGGDSAAGKDPKNSTFGLGVTTPREMVTLMEKLELGEIVSPEAAKDMLGILKRQQFHDGVGRTLLDVTIANKTGALDRLRSDVAIVYTRRGRIAMAITCDDMPEVVWNTENPGLLMLSRLSLILMDGLATPA